MTRLQRVRVHECDSGLLDYELQSLFLVQVPSLAEGVLSSHGWSGQHPFEPQASPIPAVRPRVLPTSSLLV